MVNSNMSRILMGSSVGRRKEKADSNLVGKGKVYETRSYKHTDTNI